jgi:SagB-type dehydrogenase family enzyme
VPRLQDSVILIRQQWKLSFLIGILTVSLLLLFIELFPPQVTSLSLPPPDTEGRVSLKTAIYQSKIVNNLSYTEIDNHTIAQLSWALQGLTHGPDFHYRTVPSAGATYPLEIYVFHKGNTYLKEGVYHYIPQTHSLERLSTIYELDLLLFATTSIDRDMISNVSTVFSIFAEYSRTTDRYRSGDPYLRTGARGIRYVYLEVGHAIQNFFLQATALDLQTRPITTFIEEDVQSFFNTNLIPQVLLPLGKNEVARNSTIHQKKAPLSLVVNDITVEQAITKRASIRDYLVGEIPSTILLDLLDDSFTIPYLAGNSSQLDIRVVIGNVTDLVNGIYRYFPENNSLLLITSGEKQKPLYDVSLEQPWIINAQLDIIISIDTYWVSQQLNPALYERMLLFNVGMVAQNIYHECSAHGLGTVVIGAFHDEQVASLVEVSTSFHPVYEMPIGLTPAFFEEEAVSLQLTELSRWMGILLFIPFYINFYLSVPAIRVKIPRKIRRWVHCGFSIIPATGFVIHYMIIHGYARNFWDFINPVSYVDALIGQINQVILFVFNGALYLLTRNTQFLLTWQELGNFIGNLGMFGILISSIAGILIIKRGIKHKKYIRQFHKHGLLISLVLMVVHGYTNSLIFASSSGIIILIQIIAIDSYFIIEKIPIGKSETIVLSS